MRQRILWAISWGSAALAMLVAGLLIPMYFGTNDDPYIIQALSGGGGVASEPTPYISFINVVLCGAISSLYSLLPTVSWWPIFHLTAIFVSLSAMGFVVLSVMGQPGGPNHLAARWALLGVLDFGVGAYLVGRLQFTSTASLLVAAAIVAACSSQSYGKKGRQTPSLLVIPVTLGIVGFSLREQSGLLGLFFWALAAMAALSRAKGGFWERVVEVRHGLLPIVCVGIAALVMTVIDLAAYSGHSLATSVEWSKAMSGYTDYPHPSFDEAPARYEEVGWDEELSELVNQWFMMDERVNTETLTALNEQNTAPIDNLLSDPVGTVISRLYDVSKPIPMTYFALLLGTAVVALALSPSRGERAVICLTCAAVIVLLGYLLLRGRLLERAAYAVTIPATAALLTVVLRNVRTPQREGRSAVAPTVACVLGLALLAPLGYRAETIGRMAYALGAAFCIAVAAWAMLARRESAFVGRARLVVAVLAAALVLAPGVVTVKKLGMGSWEAKRQEGLLANTQVLFDYCEEHPDTLYVYSGCPITEQYVWQGEWPTNRTGWGGWRWPYEWFDEALRAAGFDGRPTSEDFLDGNALFISGSESTCDLMLRYMRNTYGDNVEMRQVDEIACGMNVYEFVREGE